VSLKHSRRTALAGLGLVLVAIAVVVVVSDPLDGPGKPSGASQDASHSSLATVTQQSLSAQTQVNATLGYAEAATVRLPAGTPPSAVRQAEQAVANSERMLQSARESLRADGATLTNEQATVSAARDKENVDCAGENSAESAPSASSPSGEAAASGSPSSGSPSSGSPSSSDGTNVCASDVQILASDRQSSSAAAIKVKSDRTSLSSAQAAVASAEASVSAARSAVADYGQGSTFTMLPAVGQVIAQGQTVYAISGQPVVLRYGSPATRELPLGSVVFERGPVRVTSVTPELGAAVTPGPVLGVTSTRPQVTIALSAAEQSSVKVGDQVSITLPNEQTTPGVISSVGTVAKAPASKEGGSGGGGPENGEEGGPTIEVDVTPSEPRALGHLDEAPVSVSITTSSVPNALAVPVDALLALAGGGYALEVAEGNAHHLEAVTLGLFDDAEGLVQVNGQSVHAGQRVVVPST
jgi:hypothetical protein